MDTVIPGSYVIAVTNEQLAAMMRATCLDPYCSFTPRFLGITDTNALLSSVDNDCRHPRRRHPVPGGGCRASP
jgi:hypothetical protein